MMLSDWRELKGLSQGDLAEAVGLRSRAQISDIERGRQKASADLAIRIDRLTGGAVPVRILRPDLHDVRVIQPSNSDAAPTLAPDTMPAGVPAASWWPAASAPS